MSIKEAVQKEIEALNRQDVDGVMSFYTEDVVFEDVSIPEPLRGAAAMREFMESMYHSFPDLHLEIHTLFGEEDIAAAEYDMVGTHKGEFDGHAPTGKGFRIRAASVYAYNGSHFTRETFYWDSATLMIQLGLA
jgi:steroid delta-isomerase-like uncharacterized protein